VRGGGVYLMSGNSPWLQRQ